MEDNQNGSRRWFLGRAAAASGAVLASGKLWGMPAVIDHFDKPKSRFRGVQVGVITYSYRDLPDQGAEATLQYVLDSGVDAIELMGGPAEAYAGAPKNPLAGNRAVFGLLRKRREQRELTADEQKQLTEIDQAQTAYREAMTKWRLAVPMTKFEQLRKLYKKAGVRIYCFKPDAFGPQHSDAEVEYGLRAAKALGANQVTLEHPSDDAQTLRLGKLAEKYGILVGYHGHEQQTPTFWDVALAQSPANALNFDLGHFVAAGHPGGLDLIRLKHDRIASMHIKDRQNPAHGKANLPWGQGDTPVAEALKLMRDQGYKFPATVELEYQIPAGSSPVAEVKKCVEFCKNALG
jgi:sugar phosphate isomerase/epimerase